MNKIHAVEKCCECKESNLNGNLVVPVVSCEHEQEPSNDETVVITERPFIFFESLVKVTPFLVKFSFFHCYEQFIIMVAVDRIPGLNEEGLLPNDILDEQRKNHNVNQEERSQEKAK